MNQEVTMIGPAEVILVLLIWAIPIAILVWFVLAVREIRDSLRSIDRKLEDGLRGRP
jgi:hypothetical protein